MVPIVCRFWFTQGEKKSPSYVKEISTPASLSLSLLLNPSTLWVKSLQCTSLSLSLSRASVSITSLSPFNFLSRILPLSSGDLEICFSCWGSIHMLVSFCVRHLGQLFECLSERLHKIWHFCDFLCWFCLFVCLFVCLFSGWVWVSWTSSATERAHFVEPLRLHFWRVFFCSVCAFGSRLHFSSLQSNGSCCWVWSCVINLIIWR